MTNHPKRKLSKAAILTLAYFRRGYERDPDDFWIDHDPSARTRVPSLLGRGFIERSSFPGSSYLYRITQDGLAALRGSGGLSDGSGKLIA